MQTRLCFYSYGVAVESDSPQLHENLKHDFHYFLADWQEKDSLTIQCHQDLTEPQQWAPLFKIRDTIVFKGRKVQRVGFFNRAFVEYSFEHRSCSLHCDDPAISYEALYMIILSYIGERLDRDGQHRLHGFGLTSHGKGAVILAPSGGGKSTLAVELLQQHSAKILSDDTPVIDPHGKMYAFPQRISLKDPGAIPREFLRKFPRVKHGEKFVVGTRFFSSEIEPSAPIDWLILARKSNRLRSEIRAVSKIRLFWPLLKWLVVGYETPQIWQLYLRLSTRDFLTKMRILHKRLRSAGALFRRSQVAELLLSQDPCESAHTLSTFLGATH